VTKLQITEARVTNLRTRIAELKAAGATRRQLAHLRADLEWAFAAQRTVRAAA